MSIWDVQTNSFERHRWKTHSGCRMDTHLQAASSFTGGTYTLRFVLAKMTQIVPEEPSYLFTIQFSSCEELHDLDGNPACTILFLKVSVEEECIFLYSLKGSIVTRILAWQNSFYTSYFEARWRKFSVS